MSLLVCYSQHKNVAVLVVGSDGDSMKGDPVLL